MISMNISPPRLRAARKLANTPLVKPGSEQLQANMGCATLV